MTAPAPIHFVRNRRLDNLLVNGAKLRADLVDVITSATVELSSQQVSHLSFTVNDADVALLNRGAFAKGSPVDYGPLRLQVESRQVLDNNGLPALQATCRSRVIGALKKAAGGRVRTHLSPSTYVALDVRAAGGTVVAQPSPVRASIERVHDSSTNETDFDVHVRLASELGFVYFEAEGVVYFGKPSWLVRRMRPVPIHWAGRATDGRLYSVPQMRDDMSDVAAGTTGTLTGDPDFLELVVPGRACSLRGMGSYDGLYLVTGMSMQIDGFSPATVELASPIDPTPQPPDATASSTKSPTVGASAGGKASASAKAAIDAGSSVIGTPYRFGGAEPGGFDCSGLMQFAYGRAGVALPRTAAAQWSSGAHPDVAPGPNLDRLRPGDLLFWGSNPADPATIHHVAMYVGNGEMLAAPHTGTDVALQKVYPTGYVGASRPAP